MDWFVLSLPFYYIHKAILGIILCLSFCWLFSNSWFRSLFLFFFASTSLSFRSIEMKQKEKNTITQPLFPSLISCAFPLCFAPFQWTEWKKRTREARKERKTKNKSTENNPLLFLVLLVLCEESTHYIIFHLSLFTYSTKKNKARSDRKEPKLKRNEQR